MELKCEWCGVSGPPGKLIIVSQWNWNPFAIGKILLPTALIIVSQWNWNKTKSKRMASQITLIIVSQWNWNIFWSDTNHTAELTYNRITVELKYNYTIGATKVLTYNRITVELKCGIGSTISNPNLLIIVSQWNWNGLYIAHLLDLYVL